MANSELISPLAPAVFPDIAEVFGVRMSVAQAGVKYQGRTDVWLAEVPAGSTIAGVFTRSKTASAPVDWCRRQLPGGKARAVLVNSGNANAFTGTAGIEAVNRTAASVASQLGCNEGEVFLASTGVIGEPLPAERIEACMQALHGGLGDAGWKASAEAIMTTDTFAKGACRKFSVDGMEFNIAGICKGSGMIEPDMATMLGFVFTDFAISADLLQACLTDVVDTSFNAITVDSDTSTSDTVLLISTGRPGASVATDNHHPGMDEFRRELAALCEDLATQIVRDGEGASKFITIDVTGAEDNRAAKVIAKAIANSPLVKTAIAGEDANWGRVVMAVGKAGEMADRDRLSISMGGIEIAARGQAVANYDETLVSDHLRGREVHIQADVGIKNGAARVWTCDLTEGYIRINADYRS